MTKLSDCEVSDCLVNAFSKSLDFLTKQCRVLTSWGPMLMGKWFVYLTFKSFLHMFLKAKFQTSGILELQCNSLNISLQHPITLVPIITGFSESPSLLDNFLTNTRTKTRIFCSKGSSKFMLMYPTNRNSLTPAP